MNITTHRNSVITHHGRSREFDIRMLEKAISSSSEEYRSLRLLPSDMWFHRSLVFGAQGVADIAPLIQRFCEVCKQDPIEISSGEISLSGFANLLACAKCEDCTFLFARRLERLKTRAHGSDVERQWHFSRAFAGVALGVRAIYRGPAAADVELDELMPFTPRILYGNNPQALLAHLAAGAENRVAIEDVWPAFRECVHNFPYHEEVGDFDGACLFWIARIVHHQIGGQPLGQTADWLSRHFNAWADGRDLPPLGAP